MVGLGSVQPPPPEEPLAPAPPSTPDAGGQDVGVEDGVGAPAEGDAPAPASGGSGDLVACLVDAGGACRTINLAALEAGDCVQLSLDNCGGASRAGLPVTLPVSWRLGSAAVRRGAEECLPGAYDPTSGIIVDASGSIGWNLATREPSDLMVDVTLEPSSTALDPSPVAVSGAVAGALPECD